MSKTGSMLLISIARVLVLTGMTRVELAAVRMLRRFAMTLALLLVAGLGLAFLALSAFLGLQGAYGGPLAALIVGLACVIVALLGMVGILMRNRAH